MSKFTPIIGEKYIRTINGKICEYYGTKRELGNNYHVFYGERMYLIPTDMPKEKVEKHLILIP